MYDFSISSSYQNIQIITIEIYKPNLPILILFKKGDSQTKVYEVMKN